jgi:glutamate 5-kinase
MNNSLVVIKIGTSAMLKIINGRKEIDDDLLQNLINQIHEIIEARFKVIWVSSGAIQLGRMVTGIPEDIDDLFTLEALASIGQGLLFNIYLKLFAETSLIPAQILLTHHHLDDPLRGPRTIATIQRLLHFFPVVPIVNENDIEGFEEVKSLKKSAENDLLAAKIATMVKANTLLILSEFDGLFDRDPREGPAQPIKIINQFDSAVFQKVSQGKSKEGTGGALTKLEAAKRCHQAGITTIITSSRHSNVLTRVILDQEELGTKVVPI